MREQCIRNGIAEYQKEDVKPFESFVFVPNQFVDKIPNSQSSIKWVLEQHTMKLS
jgi:hypothetical protein